MLHILCWRLLTAVTLIDFAEIPRVALWTFTRVCSINVINTSTTVLTLRHYVTTSLVLAVRTVRYRVTSIREWYALVVGDVTTEETANNNTISEQRQSNRYHQHQSLFSARRRTSDDVISVAESTRTNVSSVVGKRNLADCQYVDSDAMFPPVHETVTITTQGSRSV